MEASSVAQAYALLDLSFSARPAYNGRGERELMVPCLFARWAHAGGHDRHPSMSVNLDKGVALCFACGHEGRWSDLLYEAAALAGVPADAVVSVLSSDVEDSAPYRPRLQAPAVPSAVLSALGRYHPYFAQRGIPEEVATAWRLGATERRALFPLLTASQRIPLVQGRLLVADDAAPKYLTVPAGAPRNRHLYGEHLLSGSGAPLVVLVEGPVDAIRANMALAGMGVAVASLGAHLSEEQAHLLAAHAQEVAIGYDSDVAGRGAAKAASALLRRHVLVSYVDWGDWHDAGDAPLEIIRTAVGRRAHALHIGA